MNNISVMLVFGEFLHITSKVKVYETLIDQEIQDWSCNLLHKQSPWMGKELVQSSSLKTSTTTGVA